MRRYEGSMTQSASGPYPIRPIEEDDLDGFMNVDEHAFNTSPWSDDDRRVGIDRFEFDRTLAAFDDTTPVGVTMCYSFRLSVPGQEVLPAAGVVPVVVQRQEAQLFRIKMRHGLPPICFSGASGCGGCGS